MAFSTWAGSVSPAAIRAFPAMSELNSTLAACRSAGPRRLLRLEQASPSSSRIVGQPTILGVEVQIGNEMAHYDELLEVLLTEIGAAMATQREELGDHSCDASEVPRT